MLYIPVGGKLSIVQNVFLSSRLTKRVQREESVGTTRL